MNTIFSHIKHIIISIIFLLFSSIFISCEYEPTEVFKPDLEKPSVAPPIDVDLNLLTDTVSFYWATKVNLKIRAGNREIYSVDCFLDNNKVNGTLNDSVFYIVLNFPQPGTHKFKMIISTSSGSYSIADILGAEGFQYESYEWTLIAKVPDTNNNLNYSLSKNCLTLSWEAYDGLNFNVYRLKDILTGNIINVPINSYQDEFYVGEEANYYLYVVDNENGEHLWGKCKINKSLPVLKIGNINNRISLVWEKTIFNENIAEFQVFKGDFNNHWTKIATLSNCDTSIFIQTTNNVFAESVQFYLYCAPKRNINSDKIPLFTSYINTATAALPGPKFLNAIGLSCSGFYFKRFSTDDNKNSFYKYAASSDKLIAVTDYNMSIDISPNAKYLLNPGDSILELYDLNTNNLIRSVNIKKIAPQYYSSVYNKISDNGICVFTLGGNLYVYDLLNYNLIFAKPFTQGRAKISPNGKYISIEKSDSLKIYRINENSLTFQSGLKRSSNLADTWPSNFVPNQEEIFYLYESPNIIVRSCQDLSLVRTIDVGTRFYNIDFCSNKILSVKETAKWNIYDFNTGNLVQVINTKIGVGSSNYTIISGNTIYYTGYKFILAN